MFGGLLMSGEGKLGSGVRAVRLMSLVVVNLARKRTSRTSMRQSISRDRPNKSYFYLKDRQAILHESGMLCKCILNRTGFARICLSTDEAPSAGLQHT